MQVTLLHGSFPYQLALFSSPFLRNFPYYTINQSWKCDLATFPSILVTVPTTSQGGKVLYYLGNHKFSLSNLNGVRKEKKKMTSQKVERFNLQQQDAPPGEVLALWLLRVNTNLITCHQLKMQVCF